jgi:hypothetical protein
MSTSYAKKLVSGAAAAAATIGVLITPAPANAAPDCYSEAAGYQFAGGPVVIHYPETDAETRFDAPRGINVDAPAETFYENGTSLTGRVTGKIDKGGNWINLTVTRGSKYAPLLLSGAVQQHDNNTPAGNFTWENNDMQAWDSPTQLICIPGAPVEDRPLPAPAPAPAPEPVAAEQPAPAGTAPIEAQAPPPEEAAAPPPEEAAGPNGPCVPDPFDLNFPGAC